MQLLYTYNQFFGSQVVSYVGYIFQPVLLSSIVFHGFYLASEGLANQDIFGTCCKTWVEIFYFGRQ